MDSQLRQIAFKCQEVNTFSSLLKNTIAVIKARALEQEDDIHQQFSDIFLLNSLKLYFKLLLHLVGSQGRKVLIVFQSIFVRLG